MVSYEMVNDGTLYTDTSNVHFTFFVWFTWGAINFIVLGVAAGLMEAARTKAPIVALASCARCLCCCSGLGWYIVGLVWRLNTSGSFASGDTVPEGITEEAWTDEIFRNEDDNYF